MCVCVGGGRVCQVGGCVVRGINDDDEWVGWRVLDGLAWRAGRAAGILGVVSFLKVVCRTIEAAVAGG